MKIDFRRFNGQLRAMTTEEKFWFKVSGGNVETCWEWMGKRDHDGHGYGHFAFDGKAVGAHRYAYERLIAEIPAGLDLDHLCRNTACVNPWHLEPVTRKVNLYRSHYTLASTNSAKTCCPQGHPYSDGNTYVRPNGKRECRRCRRHTNKVSRSAA